MEFRELVGKTITSIDGAEEDSEVVKITTTDGSFRMFHYQDCCEGVTLAEVHGDIDDLIGEPVVYAVESCNPDDPEPGGESSTWTFYRLATSKGLVVLRWLGESNGYYSESVDFERTG